MVGLLIRVIIRNDQSRCPCQESRNQIWHLHLEVRWSSVWSVMPPLPPPPILLLLPLLPHSCDKESQFGCQGNKLFPWRCWSTWEGQGSFVSPVMKDSPHACLIARLIVPNPTAKPIYHSLIMFNGASDTIILPVLSRCAAPTAGTFAIVAHRS